MKSWVIVFRDGRYAYGFGPTALQAREQWFRDLQDGVFEVRPAEEFHSQPHPSGLIDAVRVDPKSPFARKG